MVLNSQGLSEPLTKMRAVSESPGLPAGPAYAYCIYSICTEYSSVRVRVLFYCVYFLERTEMCFPKTQTESEATSLILSV